MSPQKKHLRKKDAVALIRKCIGINNLIFDTDCGISKQKKHN